MQLKYMLSRLGTETSGFCVECICFATQAAPISTGINKHITNRRVVDEVELLLTHAP